jgi:hypothetical protein
MMWKHIKQNRIVTHNEHEESFYQFEIRDLSERH